MPRRPARPVSWVYWPGVSCSWWSPVNLVSFSITTRPRRHVDPDRERLGGEHDLDEALDEARFDDLLERRHHPGVVRREPGLELGEELPVAEHREIGRVERAEAGVGDLRGSGRARRRW